jgi:dTDP-4-dehydrorhamnose reductase
MKVLVVGAKGQLGPKLIALLERESRFAVAWTDRGTLDVTDAAQVHAVVRQHQPDWLVNCTAHNDLEAAELDPGAAHLVNDVAVGYLADAALACRARLVHISSDYVFTEPSDPARWRPFHEGDTPAPQCAYARSKRAGECRLERHGVEHAILRTSWLYGGDGKNGKSFLRTMLAKGARALEEGRPVQVVADQWGTPTDVWSLAAQIRRVIIEGALGLFHASCEGATTWFDFARAIFHHARLPVTVEPMSLADYASRVARPQYSVLENRALLRRGIHVLPHWTQGLETCLRHV